jgi:dihydrofolate reductase
MQSAGTLLYGRRLYESMAVWETDAGLAAYSAPFADFAAAWQATSKVVYSHTLAEASTADTRIERDFDPAAAKAIKDAADRDLIVGGAGLGAQAIEAGLVDEIQLYVMPVTVGGGKPGLPTGTRVDLEFIDERRFDNGVVLLRYRPRGS